MTARFFHAVNPFIQESDMKLYYSPAACSLSPHIVAAEAGIELQLVKVDTKTKTIAKEGDFWAINPKGYVPALELDDGQVLTEGPAIVQYLADLKPAAGLAPAAGTLARYRLQEMLNYITSEIHKTYSPLFNPKVSTEVRAERVEYLQKRYALLDRHLAQHAYLVGDRFTAADAYLFVVSRWARGTRVDLGGFTHLQAFLGRIAARPAVQAAMRAEGLVPEVKAA
jgi:glutathione S-transferase